MLSAVKSIIRRHFLILQGLREINGTINDDSLVTISEIEDTVLTLLKDNHHMTSTEIVEGTGKSKRTVNRVTTSLQAKDLIERVGSKKTGYWRAK